MRFSVQLPSDRVERGSEFTSAEAIAELARASESAGFDAAYVTEHPLPSDSWLASGGHHALDPFVSLSAAAAVTTRLLLHTNILVLPYRNPFLTAKSVASLDVLSGGRVILGVAVGYLEAEYRALGADFERRNETGDEALVAMKLAWRGESFQFRGQDFEAEGNQMLPAPVQQPHPPIWVGGNTRRAMRRSAEYAQGWSPFPLPVRATTRTRTAAIENPEQLGEKIRWLQDYAREIGRSEPLDVNFVPFGRNMNSPEPLDFDAFHDQLRELQDVGVTWVSVGMPGESRAAYCDDLARFGDRVIGKYR
jgi:probable F420-dependent oxidoreductase